MRAEGMSDAEGRQLCRMNRWGAAVSGCVARTGKGRAAPGLPECGTLAGAAAVAGGYLRTETGVGCTHFRVVSELTG